MEERPFDLEAFYAFVEASAKERSQLRQDLVRGLKDYSSHLYGYDRYGAEAVLLVPERMGHPYIFGFGALRILHDRRISEGTKIATAQRLLDIIEYGRDLGLPRGLFAGVRFLLSRGALDLQNLRYALVASAGEQSPFEGMDKADVVDFMSRLVSWQEMPAAERALWSHSLIARHGDGVGAAEIIDRLMDEQSVPVEMRRELCWAWINYRQPRIEVEIPGAGGGARSRFIYERMPFWVAHTPSWPSLHMVRQSIPWLVRLGEDALIVAEMFIDYRNGFADQVHAGVADVLAEHHARMPDEAVRRLIEAGIGVTGSGPTRRRFYRLGTELFGQQYLERATEDTAGSVRQWATRELQKQS